MSQHPNARLTPKGRETLVSRIEGGLGIGEAARQMGVSRQTADRWLRRARLGESRRRSPVSRTRYGKERPGGLVHVDVKKADRIPDGGGHGALGRGAGRACLHVAAGGCSRAGCVELLQDERKETCSAFVARCIGFFAGLGVDVERVMTDNGPGYRSREFNDLLAANEVRHIYAKPFSPWQNGKVERMNRTLAQEWQYGRARESEAGRAEALPRLPEAL